MHRDKIAVLTFAFCIILVCITFFGINLILVGETGQLLWNIKTNEAYLFMDVTYRGYQYSYLGYLFETAREYFYFVPNAQNGRHDTVVFHITSSGIHKYVIQNMTFRFYCPIGGHIYAYHGYDTWVWEGARFEEASASDQHKLEHVDYLHDDFTNVDGWSSRHLPLNGPYREVAFELDGKKLKLVTTGGNLSDKLTIGLQFPDGKVQQIWYCNQRRKVDRSAYERVFPNAFVR